MNKSGSCGSSSTSSSNLRLSISANEQCVVSFIIPTSAYESTCSKTSNYNSKSLKSKGNKGHFKKKAGNHGSSHIHTSKHYRNDAECITLYKSSDFDDRYSTSELTDSPIPKKRMCIRSSNIHNISEVHSSFNDKALNQSQVVTRKEIGDNVSSCNYESEDKNPRSLFELDLNLPSSTVRHFISTNKPSPVRPRIVSINNRYKVLKKTKRKNRVCPYDALDSTGSSLRISTTINHTPLKNEECWRDLSSRYCEESLEVSSNNASTPPCNVSTCASQSSSSSSAGLKQNSSTNFLLKVRSEEIFAARQSHKCMEVFNPIFSSSLDVPRNYTHSCEFPAITKVTTSFNNYEYNNDKKEELNRNEMCYSEIAQQVFDDSFNTDKEVHFPSNTNKTLTRLASIRKEQANEITFYVAPSTDSGSTSIRKYDIENIAEFSDDERERGCCTCFFPKSNTKFFT